MVDAGQCYFKDKKRNSGHEKERNRKNTISERSKGKPSCLQKE